MLSTATIMHEKTNVGLINAPDPKIYQYQSTVSTYYCDEISSQDHSQDA